MRGIFQLFATLLFVTFSVNIYPNPLEGVSKDDVNALILEMQEAMSKMTPEQRAAVEQQAMRELEAMHKQDPEGFEKFMKDFGEMVDPNILQQPAVSAPVPPEPTPIVPEEPTIDRRELSATAELSVILNLLLEYLDSIELKSEGLPRISLESSIEEQWKKMRTQLVELRAYIHTCTSKPELLKKLNTPEWRSFVADLTSYAYEIEKIDAQFVVPDVFGLRTVTGPEADPITQAAKEQSKRAVTRLLGTTSRVTGLLEQFESFLKKFAPEALEIAKKNLALEQSATKTAQATRQGSATNIQLKGQSREYQNNFGGWPGDSYGGYNSGYGGYSPYSDYGDYGDYGDYNSYGGSGNYGGSRAASGGGRSRSTESGDSRAADTDTSEKTGNRGRSSKSGTSGKSSGKTGDKGNKKDAATPLEQAALKEISAAQKKIQEINNLIATAPDLKNIDTYMSTDESHKGLVSAQLAQIASNLKEAARLAEKGRKQLEEFKDAGERVTLQSVLDNSIQTSEALRDFLGYIVELDFQTPEKLRFARNKNAHRQELQDIQGAFGEFIDKAMSPERKQAPLGDALRKKVLAKVEAPRSPTTGSVPPAETSAPADPAPVKI